MEMSNPLFHELANLMPPMSDKEFVDLQANLRENGQIEPIVMLDNKILDGRNRWSACKSLGMVPILIEFVSLNSGISPLEFVLAKNVHRRHMTIGQRSMLANDVMPLRAEAAKLRQVEAAVKTNSKKKKAVFNPGEEVLAPDGSIPEEVDPISEEEKAEIIAGLAIDQAASEMKVSSYNVRQARSVINANPELAQKVRSGEIELRKAVRQVRDENPEVSKKSDGDLTDMEWLDRLPINGKTSGDLFVNEALNYRNMAPQILAFHKFSNNFRRTSGPLSSTLSLILEISHPKHWEICDNCEGSGQFDKNDCYECFSSGFIMPELSSIREGIASKNRSEKTPDSNPQSTTGKSNASEDAVAKVKKALEKK